MYNTELTSNKKQLSRIGEADETDFKRITVKRYFFNWKKFKDTCKIYKLTLTDNEDILGLIALMDFPDEERTEIKLLTVSVENKGKHKRYARITGCLIAFAGKRAMRQFDNYPAISLIPKTELRQHYISNYKMADAGYQLYLEGKPLLDIINEYLP